MSAGPTGQQQSRLLPYLLVILVVLLAYTVYTRLLRPAGRPAAVVTAPAPVVVSPAPAPAATPEAGPQAAAGPGPAASPSPSVVAVPPMPAGRANPFAALVVERPAARLAAPVAPPVPPPFFPGEGPRSGQVPLPGFPPSPQVTVAFRATGTVLMGGVRIAVLQAGQRTYFARVGDLVEGFRVVAVEPEFVRVQRGTLKHVFNLRE